VEVNRIYLRKMMTKWASCSSRRNITINRLLKYVPDHLVEYVVCHELAHLVEKRHNERFWCVISKNFRNYRELERDLFVYWFSLARKFPNDVRTATLPESGTELAERC
jgi:predicted metal-dependent hydrolase